MRNIVAVWAVFGAALLLCARPALGQTVNLWGQNWTGDVSSLLSVNFWPNVRFLSVQERYRRYRPACSCLRRIIGHTRRAEGRRAQGTYYGDAGGAGTCSFQYSDAQALPWASGTSFRVAMDQPFFYGSQTCGMCIAMRGTGPGSGRESSLRLALASVGLQHSRSL